MIAGAKICGGVERSDKIKRAAWAALFITSSLHLELSGFHSPLTFRPALFHHF